MLTLRLLVFGVFELINESMLLRVALAEQTGLTLD